MECLDRGFKLDKTLRHYSDLSRVVRNFRMIKPKWLNEEFVTCHKSRLIQKNYAYYKPLFPDVPINLEYIWPIKETINDST